jgi:hypothetical protein
MMIEFVWMAICAILLVILLGIFIEDSL